MNTKKIIIVLIVCTLLLAGIFTAYFFKQALNSKRLPIIGQVKPFELTDSHGQKFSSHKLRGKVWIANFFFTTCSDICPVMQKNMASLNRTFEKVRAVHLVSFTVNPEYDTSQTLSNYAKSVDTTKEDNWHFLTGSREDLNKIVIDSFKLGSIEQPIFHSPYFSLVDRNGYIRGYYDGTDQEAINKLFKDSSQLIKER